MSGAPRPLAGREHGFTCCMKFVYFLSWSVVDITYWYVAMFCLLGTLLTSARFKESDRREVVTPRLPQCKPTDPCGPVA